MATFDGARIPVFASIPSKLDAEQLASREYIYSWLERVGLEPRTVGGSDNSYFNPLHEVRTLARHCAGGVILGYHQVFAKVAEVKVRHEATGEVLTKKVEYRAPTPWNQLETGILFGLGLPLLVLKQRGITGGIFDEGAGDVFVQEMPMPGALEEPDYPRFEQALYRWQALVRRHYYGDK